MPIYVIFVCNEEISILGRSLLAETKIYIWLTGGVRNVYSCIVHTVGLAKTLFYMEVYDRHHSNNCLVICFIVPLLHCSWCIREYFLQGLDEHVFANLIACLYMK